MVARPAGGAKKWPATNGPEGRREGGSVSIHGFHAVLAALTARRRVPLAIHVTAAAAERLADAIAAAGLVPRILTGEELSQRLGPSAVHQGVLLEAGLLPQLSLDDIESRSGLVLVLDQITDPHNVGAILRTAAAYAVDALVTTTRPHAEPRRHGREGCLGRAGSGAGRGCHQSRTRARDPGGTSAICASASTPTERRTWRPRRCRRPLALVLGAEDKGLRRLTRENCDMIVRLDMPGLIKSLNVSNACAVALTLASLQSQGLRQDDA